MTVDSAELREGLSRVGKIPWGKRMLLRGIRERKPIPGAWLSEAICYAERRTLCGCRLGSLRKGGFNRDVKGFLSRNVLLE